MFWSVWRTSYLQHLRTTHTVYNFPKRVSTIEPQVGIVVLVAKPKVKRHQWRLGQIIKLNVSEDGQICSAQVQMGVCTKGLALPKSCKIITRPLFHLYPLEIPEEIPEKVVQPPENYYKPKEQSAEVPRDSDQDSIVEIECEVIESD